MTDLFLIAHKVSGAPAFDVARKIVCPECGGHTDEPANADWEHQYQCNECDSLGYWWIIPTSGHRAYPYYQVDLDFLGEEYNYSIRPGPMPPDLPDHYTTTYHPEPRQSLIDRLGLKPKPDLRPFPRRI